MSVLPVRRVLQVHQELPVKRDHKVQQVQPVPLVHKVRQVHRVVAAEEQQVRQDLQVPQGLQDQRVRLAYKDQLV